MRIGLHLPPSDAIVREWRIEQRLAGLRTRFGAAADIVVLASSNDARRYNCGGCALLDLEGGQSAPLDIEAHFWETAPPTANRPSYRVSSIGRVLPLSSVELTRAEDPSLDMHAFNRGELIGCGEVDYSCFRFFPYGYLFRYVGLGPTDAFGHRIDRDPRELRQRSKVHKLVLCFGGSAVWGTSVLFEQCFPAQLERLLNAWSEESATPMRFTVLNYGVPGGVVLNAMQRLMLFGVGLRPDVVIFHDGVNDFYYADTSDPRLLSGHDIVYQQNLETWADILHRADAKDQRANLSGPLAAPRGAAPLDVLRAYLRRKREAITLAKAFGAKVISGLQPFADSKSRLSTLEKERIAAWRGVPPNHQSEFALVAGLYQLISRERPLVGADIEVNFHDEFGPLSPAHEHFADSVHLDIEGEAHVAATYSKAIGRLMQHG